MTWNQLRHFHKEQDVISLWLTLFRPALRWLTPGRRHLFLSLGAIVVVIRLPLRNFGRFQQSLGFEWSATGAVLLIVSLLGFVFLCYLAARNIGSLPSFVRRHPQICLHAVLWTVLLVTWMGWPQNLAAQTFLVGAVFALPSLLWRIGYMMFTAQRGKMGGTRFTDHLFYIYPIWGGTDTPYGKGFDYLSVNEARDESTLAKSQLAGIKLFLLAALWMIGKGILAGVIFWEDNFVSRTFGHSLVRVPRLGNLFANPAGYPLWLSWVALYLELIWAVLSLAVTGHLIIGWLRFFGFNVFRNTYKPLLAESVVEFWNRYYYYFKELLVNFFFYPTFTRYFKTFPRLRIFAAVFMAAFVGNVYYHWLGLDAALGTANFTAMWAGLQSRFFYCFWLATGIYVSMLREQTRAKEKRVRGPLRRIVAILGVWTFFSVIHIWAKKDPAPFFQRTQFFLGLLGWR